MFVIGEYVRIPHLMMAGVITKIDGDLITVLRQNGLSICVHKGYIVAHS